MKIALYGMPCAGKSTLMDRITDAKVTNGSQEFGTAEISGAVWYMGGFQSIPTMPAFDFSGQPSVLRFPSLLEGGICHKFFPAFKPCVRGNECFVGSDNKYLVF